VKVFGSGVNAGAPMVVVDEEGWRVSPWSGPREAFGAWDGPFDSSRAKPALQE
jgi:hypothetical protein